MYLDAPVYIWGVCIVQGRVVSLQGRYQHLYSLLQSVSHPFGAAGLWAVGRDLHACACRRVWSVPI